MNSLILGVDPGVNGAFALYDPNCKILVGVWDAPTTPYKTKKIINISELAFQIEKFVLDIGLAIVEDVHSMPNQGVVSAFSFGVSKGIVLGILGGFRIPTVLIRPEVWKMGMNLSRDKNDSRNLAIKLFPQHSQHFGRKKDDGRAEALLLAIWGARGLAHEK